MTSVLNGHLGAGASTDATTWVDIDVDVDVVVVGAGPVGLTLANTLGLQGVRTLLVDARDELIDYPRGVGLDDESLRGFQAIGLVERVLPHTTPHQVLRFLDARGRVLARIDPPGEPFGWPRRNGFVQPLVDVELLTGLDRFEHVDIAWGSAMVALEDTGDVVNVDLAGVDGPRRVRARYVVGSDGGSSATRRHLGTSFEGTTSATRWLVVDLATDPLGRPNIDVGADPARPYVSVSIAHGIRRFEFMVHAEESDEQAQAPAFVTALLARFVPHPERVEVLRSRVYVHHSRIAGEFRRGRILLAGDAAHLMPVWQGQGYNSGIRDAVNLGWKLAAVVNGQAGDALLDSYDTERRGHAQAMINLSTTVGRVISPTHRGVAALRDRLLHAASAVPALKRYIVEMRFKPMPRYERGAVVHLEPRPAGSATGTLFIQPRVDTRTAEDVRLDEVLGPWFSVLCWNNDPRAVLGADAFSAWGALGARIVELRPVSQLHWDGHDDPEVTVVGDRTGALKRWFDDREESVLFVRPDRCVAGAGIAQRAPELSSALLQALSLIPGGHRAPSPSGHVAQSAAGHR